MTRLIIACDIDGVLNPDITPYHPAMRAHGYRTHLLDTTIADRPRRFKVWVNTRHADMLASLAHRCDAELVWLSTWGELANTWLAPRLGLPALPVWYAPTVHPALNDRDPVAWATSAPVSPKLEALLDRAAGQPFAWLDDEITPADHLAVQRHHPEGLLVDVDHRYGLVQAHLDRVAAWHASRLP